MNSLTFLAMQCVYFKSYPHIVGGRLRRSCFLQQGCQDQPRRQGDQEPRRAREMTLPL